MPWKGGLGWGSSEFFLSIFLSAQGSLRLFLGPCLGTFLQYRALRAQTGRSGADTLPSEHLSVLSGPSKPRVRVS